MNHAGATSAAGQETRPFGTFRNVHEVDAAALPCVSAGLCLHALPASLHWLQTFVLLQRRSKHLKSPGSSSRYKHIPNFAS